jgi:hypothetical protein
MVRDCSAAHYQVDLMSFLLFKPKHTEVAISGWSEVAQGGRGAPNPMPFLLPKLRTKPSIVTKEGTTPEWSEVAQGPG